MPPSTAIAVLTLLAVLAMMGLEAALSRLNERRLRAAGAVEPPGDVYRTMRIVYPACFLAMAAEGALTGPATPVVLLAGLGLLGAAKALKFWAIASLGPLWSFRVLLLPQHLRVTSGPYRWLRHPNYLAVVAELVSVALAVHAPFTGTLAVLVFGWLIYQRIRVEEEACRRHPSWR